jgi:DNA-binding response OmpR family regulator
MGAHLMMHASTVPNESSPKETIHLLIVDDELDLLESLSTAFSRRGMTVSTALDGLAGLALLGRQEFDVVLLDLNLPGPSGIEILSALKRDRPTTEVILLTGRPSMGSAAEGLREGIFDYLIKPQSIENLVRQISAAALRRRKKHQLRPSLA